jgi:CRISPR-associated endonuclease Csn1
MSRHGKQPKSRKASDIKPHDPRRYRIGIDVGLYSVGLAAIEIAAPEDTVDGNGEPSSNPYDAMPVSILNAQSVIHDGAVDPADSSMGKPSRKKDAGVARRVRKMRARRKQRLEDFDRILKKYKFPIIDDKKFKGGKGKSKILQECPWLADSWFAWEARLRCVQSYIENDQERKVAVSVALRHIARHRGWRNPYSDIKSLFKLSEFPSAYYQDLFDKVEIWKARQSEDVDTYSEDVDTYSCGPTVTKRQEEKKRKSGEVYTDTTVEVTGVTWDASECAKRPTIAELIAPLLRKNRELQPKSGMNPREAPSLFKLRGDTNSNKAKRTKKNVGTHVFTEMQINTFLGKLHQSDNLYEVRKILATQKIDDKCARQIIFGVNSENGGQAHGGIFEETNPRDVGAALSLTGTDALPGQETLPRASRASLAFQEYRILSTLANLGIKDGRENPKLTDAERRKAFTLLCHADPTKISWNDLADELGVERSQLSGVGGQTEDGEAISNNRPPVMQTLWRIEHLKEISSEEQKKITEWLDSESTPVSAKEWLILEIDNAGKPDLRNRTPEEIAASDMVQEFLASLDEESEEQLLNTVLEKRRAAYSVNSLQRLNKQMLTNGLNLHESRKAEFGVANDWRPPSNPLGTLTGNPAVDRTIKIVSRWILACVREWGKPETVNIEHVRAAFMSPEAKQKADLEAKKRGKNNLKTRERIAKERGLVPEAIRKEQIHKWRALSRQGSCCLYCGEPIVWDDCEMDHIVPRKGGGSSNRQTNLVATCRACNADKGNIPFATWASSPVRKRPQVSLEQTVRRVRDWNFKTEAGYFNQKQFQDFKRDVITRLKQTEKDEPLDNRSLESTAWMAVELRNQIADFLGVNYQSQFGDAIAVDNGENIVQINSETGEILGTEKIEVYRGAITAEARCAARIEKELHWLGGAGAKTRLDRRHHAVDAAVMSLINPKVMQVLNTRIAIHAEQNEQDQDVRYLSRLMQSEQGQDKKAELQQKIDSRKQRLVSLSWEKYDDNGNKRYLYWRDRQMQRLLELLNGQFDNDQIAVARPLRLRLGNSEAHADTVHKFYQRKLGCSFSPEQIDLAESPALWLALRACPDFNEKTGLPKNNKRQIKVHGKVIHAQQPIAFMVAERSHEERIDGQKTGKKIVDKTAKQVFEDLTSPAKKDATFHMVGAPVRGGFAECGSPHHVRIYRIAKEGGGKCQYEMLRVYQPDLIAAIKNERRKAKVDSGYQPNYDLFTVELPPWSISVRMAISRLREAMKQQSAEQLKNGWLVVGDEILINHGNGCNSKLFDPARQKPYALNKFMRAFTRTHKKGTEAEWSEKPRRFTITGFSQKTKITIAALQFSGEGLPEDISIRNDLKLLEKTYWFPQGSSHDKENADWDIDNDIRDIKKCIWGAKGELLISVDELLQTHPTIIRRDALGRERWHSRNHMPCCWKVD